MSRTRDQAATDSSIFSGNGLFGGIPPTVDEMQDNPKQFLILATFLIGAMEWMKTPDAASFTLLMQLGIIAAVCARFGLNYFQEYEMDTFRNGPR